MANCYGGIIILGVVENPDGSFYTTGLQDAAKMKKEFWDCINNRNKTSINLLMDKDVVTYEMGDDVIMVIHVPRAGREQKPVYINGDMWSGTFRRNWEGDYHCTPSEIRAMLRDEPENTMDMMVLEEFTLADLNDEAVQGYRNYHSAVRPGHVWEKLPRDEYLEKIGAAGRLKESGELRPTAAGLLMFGEEYRQTFSRLFSGFPGDSGSCDSMDRPDSIKLRRLDGKSVRLFLSGIQQADKGF